MSVTQRGTGEESDGSPGRGESVDCGMCIPTVEYRGHFFVRDAPRKAEKKRRQREQKKRENHPSLALCRSCRVLSGVCTCQLPLVCRHLPREQHTLSPSSRPRLASFRVLGSWGRRRTRLAFTSFPTKSPCPIVASLLILQPCPLQCFPFIPWLPSGHLQGRLRRRA